jgi:hypothetical protein
VAREEVLFMELEEHRVASMAAMLEAMRGMLDSGMGPVPAAVVQFILERSLLAPLERQAFAS